MSNRKSRKHSGGRRGPGARARQRIRDDIQATAWGKPDPMDWVPGDSHLGGRAEPRVRAASPAEIEAAIHHITFHRGNGMPLAARCSDCLPGGWSLGIADGHEIRAFIRVLCEHQGFAQARLIVAEAFDSLQYLKDRKTAA
jgi:hypothetical protein